MQETRKREIRVKADAFRANCKLGRYGIIDLFKECERNGYKLLRYPIREHSDLGFVVQKDRDIVIFTNSCSRLSRELFTLAHEIGHVLLHLNDADSFIDNSVTINGKSTDEREQEANYFAASLLMPEDDTRRFIDLEIPGFQENGLSAMDIARIMSEFNVSFDMVLNRLESIGVIDTNQKIKLDNEKTEMKVGNLLRGVGGNSKLNVASEVIDIPYEYIEYTIYNYNHNAIPKETLERVLACYGLSIDDVSDKIVTHLEAEDDLDDLIGGLDD
ncbi:ImmA/IrrE family metallo-endopeptidase [Agathobacter ruminis]|uniref:Zn peptidase n=1 Tax=Agathobacter ruminis TaxID=1712665 RepID=A0A2G3E5K4_9FIRM|nr:ImmA/IrrE family metallo-endopeptidase [Agathobacter ruminis]MDC7301144.1 ImmA/IrrE family metallo-endopeptidase [Agathobacter ruminis]PHU38363.1 Zn peptidase [Agathobacter ruminis]